MKYNPKTKNTVCYMAICYKCGFTNIKQRVKKITINGEFVGEDITDTCRDCGYKMPSGWRQIRVDKKLF